MTQCYEFIDIRVKSELIQARPIAWDREIYDGEGNDINGEPAKATKFEATCPYCGNMIHFEKTEMYLTDNVKCEICGAGNEKPNVEATAEKSTEGTDTSRESKPIKPRKSLFQDPIASGLFDIEVDHELLGKVESAESN